MQIHFRVPHPENFNFMYDLPAVPRVGEQIETNTKTYTVKAVVWYISKEEPSPYLILE